MTFWATLDEDFIRLKGSLEGESLMSTLFVTDNYMYSTILLCILLFYYSTKDISTKTNRDNARY